MSSWFAFAKKYLWHEEKTPFHLSPSEMSKLQASNELKLFAIFEGIIAGMMGFGIYSQFHATGETNLFPGLIYCLFLLFALFLLVKHKHFYAGIFCVTPPLVVFGMILWFGFHPNNGSFEKIILSSFLAFWFFYSIRIIEISRCFQSLKDEPASSSQRPVHQ
mgnify:FL=1